MLSLKESIISSNNAESQMLYNKTTKKGCPCSILLNAPRGSLYRDPTFTFDSKKVDDLLKKLPKQFKTDILYFFNRYSDSTNKILIKILCLLMPCTSEKEIEKLITSTLSESSIKDGVYPDRINFDKSWDDEIIVYIGLAKGHSGSASSIRYTSRFIPGLSYKKISF